MNRVKSIFKSFLCCAVLSLVFSSNIAYSENILDIEGGEHTLIGIYIKDLRNDSVIYNYNSDICLTPASVTKLYTAASALCLLDKNFRFKTNVYLTGSEGVDGVWNGNIIIKASGDPTLESEYFKDYSGFIASIISALKSKGISQIKGDIILARVNENHQYPEGPVATWNINDVGWTYGSGAFDFNWCDNYFGIYPATGKMTSPVNDLNYTVWDKPWNKGLSIIRGVYSDSLIISGNGYKTDTKAKVNTSMPYPFHVFRNRLIARLENDGIIITCKASSATDNKLLITTHQSPKLDDILRSMMIRSDNMFAEAILRTLGSEYGNIQSSLNAESRLWTNRGIDVNYATILDGSGLSRTNAISARMFGDVLEWMADSDLYDRYLTFFPKAGVNGTMKNFSDLPAFKGKLALKTGSVNGVQCYGGYMTEADNSPSHVVVILINNFYCSRADLRKAVIELLNKTIVNQ